MPFQIKNKLLNLFSCCFDSNNVNNPSPIELKTSKVANKTLERSPRRSSPSFHANKPLPWENTSNQSLQEIPPPPNKSLPDLPSVSDYDLLRDLLISYEKNEIPPPPNRSLPETPLENIPNKEWKEEKCHAWVSRVVQRAKKNKNRPIPPPPEGPLPETPDYRIFR